MENSEIVGLTASLLDDKRNIMTTAERLENERRKEKVEKGATAVHAAKVIRTYKTEIHTALTMLTICSGGTLFPITIGIAGILLAVGPVIDAVGNHIELKLLFNLVHDYCMRFYKTFMVISRMMYLITLFSKNREHFKTLLYGDILADIKTKPDIIRQAQKMTYVGDLDVHVADEVDIVQEANDKSGINEFTALLDQWKREGYGNSPGMISTGTFPQTIYDDLSRTIDDMFKALLKNVDSNSLKKLVQLDERNMFGFRKEQEKRGAFLAVPEIIRKWQVAGRKDQIIAEFNTNLTRLSSGMLLMKLHVDTQFMYIENNCSEIEVKLLHIAVTTSPEFIAYVEPTYDMTAIMNGMALSRLKLIESSIASDLKLNAQKIKDKFAQVLVEIKRNSQTAEEAVAKIHEKEEEKQLLESATQPILLDKRTRPRTSQVAPAPVPDAAPAPAPARTFWSRFKFYGGKTRSKTRKRRRRGGVSSRRRGRAI
jgi:hypothetical protein